MRTESPRVTVLSLHNINEKNPTNTAKIEISSIRNGLHPRHSVSNQQISNHRENSLHSHNRKTSLIT